LKVFLTGATGFIGSYVLRRLAQRGKARVAAVVRNQATSWRIRSEMAGIEIVPVDLGDSARLREAIVAFQPTHVVHLAWSGVLGKNRNDPTQHANVLETMRLFEYALEAGARHFVGLGSQAEYGPRESRIDEATPTAPTTLYGAAKLATSIMASQLCALHGARLAWLRVFSSYGPMDHPEWMIPYLVLKLLHRERPSVTAAEQRWDYIYVEDVADAVLAVMDSESAGGVFNLGSGAATALREIIECVRDNIDPSLPIGFGEVPYRPDQVMHLEADITRLKQATSWRPSIGLAEGIRRTVQWYRTQDA